MNSATIVKLFCHEIYRVFSDRITDELDDKWLKSLIYKTVVTRFCTSKDLQETLVEEREKHEENVAEVPNEEERGKRIKKAVTFKTGLVHERNVEEHFRGVLVPLEQVNSSFLYLF